jgi:tetraacyldisaccharide 4'-kinase
VLTTTPRARLERAWRDGLPAPWDALLAGAALAYRGGLAARDAAYTLGLWRTRSLACRVVAVGNLTVGGTGKTPLVELIAGGLAARGRRVAIVSRGYGRRTTEPVVVVADGRGHCLTAREGGDEPCLLARRLPGIPVVVGRDRHEAGAVALARFAADVLVLDDGFQQRRLRTDASVVAMDARAPWGHHGLFPRGSLREPPAALARAHLVVLTRAGGGEQDARRAEAEVQALAPAARLTHAVYEAEGVEDLRSGAVESTGVLAGRPCLAFAGIAVPERFLATLEAVGLAPRDFVAFPDHHAYTPGDLARLETRARALGAVGLLTTEKDAVRVTGLGLLPVWALRVRLRLDDGGAALWATLDARLAG